jgi:hypothetical protein
MTTAELLQRVLEGFIVIVGEYRGSNVELAGYVDRKTGCAINYIRATHLVEVTWFDRVDRVLITQAFPETVTTVEEATATLSFQRGQKYVFFIEWFKRERGTLLARLLPSEPELIEGIEEAGCPPGGRAPAP